MKALETSQRLSGSPPPATAVEESLTMTLEAFLASDVEGYEYVEGELVPMAPPTMEHGEISTNVVWYLQSHVRENQLGRVYTAETTFRLGERAVKPDAAFVAAANLPEDRRQSSPQPPDLAVEVVSPSDTLYSVAEKTVDYLNAGTRLVWVIEPVTKTVTVYRSRTDIRTLKCGDTLTGEDVVEGFACQVEELFE